MSQASQQAHGSAEAQNGRISEDQLAATQNPALARLVGAVRGPSTLENTENYSRMHHRHSRS